MYLTLHSLDDRLLTPTLQRRHERLVLPGYEQLLERRISLLGGAIVPHRRSRDCDENVLLFHLLFNVDVYRAINRPLSLGGQP